MVQTRSSFLQLKTRSTTSSVFPQVYKKISKTTKKENIKKDLELQKKVTKKVKVEKVKVKKVKVEKEKGKEEMTEKEKGKEEMTEKVEKEEMTEKVKVKEEMTEKEKVKEEKELFTFDDAHNHWIANKKLLSNGHYAYLCGKPLSKGNCKNICCDKLGLYGGCKLHFKWDEPL